MPADELYLVGAGGFGREVAGWLMDTGTPVAGFLDHDKAALAAFPDFPVRVVGDDADWAVQPHHKFLVTLGDPMLKRIVTSRLLGRGGRLHTAVSPTASVSPHAAIGPGCIIGGNCGIAAHATLGVGVTLIALSTIGHDARVGDYCQISAHCEVSGGAVLAEGVLMGSHAVVLPHATVGDYAIVGAGSVVVKAAPARTTVFGVPAKNIWEARHD
jgi:sugar O-acyltransferase (sialic acid O-acetyltransferase NeuD family)